MNSNTRKHKLKRLIPFIALYSIALSNPSLAEETEEAPISVSLSSKLTVGASWKGHHKDGSDDFEADPTQQFQVGLRIRKGRLYGGLSAQGGQFEFDERAPNKEYKESSEAANNVTIRRGELDIVLGYYFWSQFSLFFDLKSSTNTWEGEKYETNYTGLGFGGTGFIPLSDQWILYGSVGFMNLNIKNDEDNIGSGRSSALELGGLFKLNRHISFSAGLKTQHSILDFDNDSRQVYDIGGLTFGFNYLI